MAASPRSATSTADDNGLPLVSFGIAAHSISPREGHLAAPASSFIGRGRRHCPSSDLSLLDALLLRHLYSETRISPQSISRALPLSRTVLRDSESPTSQQTEQSCTADAEPDRLHRSERTATSRTLDGARGHELNHGSTAVRSSQKVGCPVPFSMFEGVATIDSSRTDSRYTYTRLALGGVRGRSIRERRSSRRVVLAASAETNTCLVALLGQRRADSNGSLFSDSRRNGGGKCMRYT